MGRGTAWLAVLLACPVPALAQPAAARAFVARLIAEAGAEGVFADASTPAQPQARHLASGLLCRFALGRPASIKLLPARAPADNVGCTMARGSGILALQVQRIPANVDAARFMVDMVEVVHADFPDAAPLAPPSADPPPLRARRFKATFQGRPVYVGVSAVRAGPWMVSGHRGGEGRAVGRMSERGPSRLRERG
jgi:hypothetical protein